MEPITWSDFEKVHLCGGTVLAAEDLPNARKPAYVLTVDFGPHGVKRSSAQITTHYMKEDLVGRQVVAVINFPPKQVGSVISKYLITNFTNTHNNIVLTNIKRHLPNKTHLI